MASLGTLDFTARLDARSVTAVVAAMGMMAERLKGYGHTWTSEEQTIVDQAVAACDRTRLEYTAARPILSCPEHGVQREIVVAKMSDVVRCMQCNTPLVGGG